MFALLQYMGSQMSDRVRLKCIELLYGWSQVLSHEPKVKEAYQMMKRQGIIKYDPVHIDKVGILCQFIIFSEKNRIRHLCSAKDTDLAQRSLYFHCTSKSVKVFCQTLNLADSSELIYLFHCYLHIAKTVLHQCLCFIVIGI